MASAPVLNEALAAVRGLKWHNFELLVAEGFRVQGFSVTEVNSERAPGEAEGGEAVPDLVLVKNDRRFCVQCRDWQEPTVGVAAVQDLYGAMLDREATAGFIVTAGEVAEEAASLAHARNIQFVKGAMLLAMMEKARTTITSAY